MDKGGRPKNVVWNDFFCVKEGNKTYGRCKKCGHTMANRVDRMKTHIVRCKNVEHMQDEGKDYVNETKIVHMETDTKSVENNISVKEKRERHSLAEENESTSNATGVKTKRVCLQDDINNYILKTTANTKKQLDLQVAKFFYSCNIPFNVVEQNEFVKLIQLLRPGYKPPSRKAISGSLLDEITETLETEMKSEVLGKNGTLVEDGWSNVHNEAVIASCLHVEGKVFFLEATDCAGQSKTAEFCKEKVKSSIALAKEKFSCNVLSVVTDNERKMDKMRQLLKEENDDLLVYGCCAHWMNLLGNEITPPGIMKHVVEVQKYFRNHHLPSAWLKESKDTVKPQLPNDTRWNSQLTCIDSFIRNRSSYVKICEDHDIEQRIVQLVNNYNLYQQVKELQIQLKPLADSLDKVQGDNATLADACQAWFSLAKDENLVPHYDAIVKRMVSYLQPVHYLAYMTHPVYKGELLNDEQREAARTWLHETQPSFLKFLIAFEAESPPFPGSFFLVRDVSAKVWWKGLKNSNFPTEFLQLMVLLHSSPCSSASIERIFSNFGLIHSKLRNKLGVQKASKLVFCYRMLRGKKELEWD